MLGSTLTYDPGEVCFSQVKLNGDPSNKAWQIMLWLSPCNIINALFGTSLKSLGSWARMKRTMREAINLSHYQSVTTLIERRRTFIAYCYMHNPAISAKIMFSKVLTSTYKLMLIHPPKWGTGETWIQSCNFLWSSKENLLEGPKQSPNWEVSVSYLIFFLINNYRLLCL